MPVIFNSLGNSFFSKLQHHIAIKRTARYEQLGKLSSATRQVWIVLHGYGQLAEYFIRHFAPLHATDPTGTVIIAPEGLSRFYLNGTSGRVGASWMTRADRLTEIDDQINYLNQLADLVLVDCPAEVRVTVLGFLQGTATASRWLAHDTSRWRPHHLILWAGDFPADIDFGKARQLLQNLPVTLVSGKQDDYVSPTQLRAHTATLREHGANVTTLHFEGGHTMNADVLRRLHTASLA